MSKNLNENQLLAVQLVAQGRSGKEIAKELSVTEETISRWKKQPAFIALVNDLLGQLRDTTWSCAAQVSWNPPYVCANERVV